MDHVSFPGLGLEFELRRSAFSVFGIDIYWYGIIITLGFLAAILMALRSSRKYDLTADNILDLVLYAAPVAIIFSRLYYVIFNWDQFRHDLASIIRIRDGGLAIYGAVIGALLVAWIYTRKKKISFLKLVDFAVPYLVFGQGIGRWGNFINQEAFGTATQLPWRMNGNVIDEYLWRNNYDQRIYGVHPTFLYESLLDIAIFLFLLFWRKRKKAEGEVLSLYFILYGTARALIEGLRTDSLWLGSLRVSQALSVILVVVGIVLFLYRRAAMKKAEEGPVVLGQSKYGALLMKMKEEEAAEAKATATEEAEAAGAGTDETEKAGAEGSKEAAAEETAVTGTAGESPEGSTAADEGPAGTGGRTDGTIPGDDPSEE